MSVDLSSADELWRVAIRRIEGHLSKPSLESFVKAMRPVSLRGDTLTFAVPSRFAKEWVESRYLDLIRDALRSVAGRDLTVTFSIAESTQPAGPPAAPSEDPPTPRPLAGLALFPK